jgi:hypothetical protein
MRKLIFKFMILLIAVPIIFIGCKKTDVSDPNSASGKADKTVIAYCGTPETFNLYPYDNLSNSFGTVTIGNDASNIYITVSLTGNWLIYNSPWPSTGIQMFIGTLTQLQNPLLSENITGNSTGGSGDFHYDNFPYQYLPATLNEQTHTFTIARSTLQIPCPYYMVIEVQTINSVTNEAIQVTAKSNFKNSGYYLTYCPKACETCETVYARGPEPASTNPLTAFCFYNTPLNLNNWGWTNKIVQPYDQLWPVYAGNPSCEGIASHQVGTVHVNYAGNQLTVQYNIDPGFTLSETHLWVNSAPLPKKNGKYVAAPGSFTYNGLFTDGQAHTVPATGPIYIAAHGVVCGVYGW